MFHIRQTVSVFGRFNIFCLFAFTHCQTAKNEFQFNKNDHDMGVEDEIAGN